MNKSDTVLFFVSLFLSVSFWIIHSLSLEFSTSVSVPVVAVSNIPGRFSESSYPVEVVARCRTNGYSAMIASGNPVRVRISPDDLHYMGGDYFSMSANEMSAYAEKIFGPGVTLESFMSSSYTFRFSVENNKTVPVEPAFNVIFKEQYMQSAPIALSPDSVMVYGDPTLLEKIDRIYTQPLTLDNVSASRQGSVPLMVPEGMRLSDSQSHYTIPVSRFVEIRKNVRMSVRGVPASKELLVFPSTAEVTFRCAFPVNGDITENVQFYIDYQEFASSINGRCMARFDEIPEGILDYSVTPEIFECLESEKE